MNSYTMREKDGELKIMNGTGRWTSPLVDDKGRFFKCNADAARKHGFHETWVGSVARGKHPNSPVQFKKATREQVIAALGKPTEDVTTTERSSKVKDGKGIVFLVTKDSGKRNCIRIKDPETRVWSTAVVSVDDGKVFHSFEEAANKCGITNSGVRLGTKTGKRFRLATEADVNGAWPSAIRVYGMKPSGRPHVVNEAEADTKAQGVSSSPAPARSLGDAHGAIWADGSIDIRMKLASGRFVKLWFAEESAVPAGILDIVELVRI